MHEMLPPITEEGYHDPNPDEPNMVLCVTPDGTVRLVFATPVTFVELDYDQATDLQKGIHRALRQIRRSRHRQHQPKTHPPLDLHKVREMRIARAAKARGDLPNTEEIGDNGRHP